MPADLIDEAAGVLTVPDASPQGHAERRREQQFVAGVGLAFGLVGDGGDAAELEVLVVDRDDGRVSVFAGLQGARDLSAAQAAKTPAPQIREALSPLPNDRPAELDQDRLERPRRHLPAPRTGRWIARASRRQLENPIPLPSQPRMRGHAIPSAGQNLDRFWIDFRCPNQKFSNSQELSLLLQHIRHFTTAAIKPGFGLATSFNRDRQAARKLAIVAGSDGSRATNRP